MASLFNGRVFQVEVGPGANASLRVTVTGQLRDDFQAKEVIEPILAATKPAAGKPIEIDVGGVALLNSVGINQWILLISNIEKQHAIQFVTLSESFIEIGFMIPNVLGRKENGIENLKLPYRCTACKRSASKTFGLKELLNPSGRFAPPTEACPNCSKPMQFDAIEEEYEGFLLRRLP